MADDEASVVNEIQNKYVPFLKKLISFLEKTKKATPETLSRLKSIYTVFTSSPEKEQVEVFQSNKKKLEKWFTSSKKDKFAEGGTSKDKRSLDAEDTDSSQGAFENSIAKKPKLSVAAESPATIAQIKMEKAEKPKIIEPSRPKIVTNKVTSVQRTVVVPTVTSTPAPASPSSNGDKIVFTCASCQFQTTDEQEFMKHTRTDHRSDLSMWCKQCGKCFSNAGVLVSHIKERACKMEEMIYRCGVKDCSFETTSGQTFVHHLRHCHKGSPFIFCVHCQKIFTLPHCLILHMQDDCPYKDKNRRNPGSGPAVNTPNIPSSAPITPSVSVRPQAPSFSSKAPSIASVVSTPRASTPVVNTSSVTARGRGALMPTARGRGRGKGRGRGRPLSESSDSDDADDPLWKPEELPGAQTLRRSGRWAKKVNDVVNVEPKQMNKGLSLSELNTKEMLRCPCCDFMAAFKSVLQDHYIAHHKVPNKNACLVCHLKFEATQGFLDHFEDHASGRLPNKVMVPEDTDEVSAVAPQDTSKTSSNTTGKKTELSVASDTSSFDKESIKGVVKNLSEVDVVNPTSAQSQFVKIPYQAVTQEKNLRDTKLKKFEELKAPSDLVAMSNPDKLKCFFKCVAYNCSYTTHDSCEYLSHLDLEHYGTRLHCGFCLKDFLSAPRLTDHLMSVHSKRQYQCSHCFYRAYSKIHVQIHIKNFHSKDANLEVLECDPIKIPQSITVEEEPNDVLNTTWPFVCAIGDCNFQTFDPKEFKEHNESSHRSVSVFFCHYCKVDFLSFKRLLNHYRLHGINTFQCNYCIHGSETKDEILLHLCNAHADFSLKAYMRGTEEDASSEAKLLPYSVCSEAEKTNKRNNSSDSRRPESPPTENDDKNRFNYEIQMYEIVGETYYPKYLKSICSNLVCGIPGCIEKFENMLSYIGHLKNCHAAENFPCPHCPNVSDSWEEFKNHLMCHGPELYSCSQVTCTFYDWDKNAVTKHLKSHPQTNSKVIIVREPFDGVPDENDVKQINSLPQSCPFKVGEEFFQCCFCEYKSSDKNVMKNHMYLELYYLRFCCSSCNEKFVSRKEIKDHYMKKHLKEEIKCSINPCLEIENIVNNILNKKVHFSHSNSNQCGNCSKNFKSLVQWQCHVVLCLQNFYRPFVCNYCKFNCHSLKILKFHVDRKHFPKPIEFFEVSSVTIEQEIGIKVQQARLKFLKKNCSNFSTTDNALSMKLYTCSACSYESNHKYNLELHIEKEHEGNAEINKVSRDIKLPEINSSQLDENSNDSTKASNESSKNVKRFRCGMCIKKLHTLQELESHVESVHPVREEVEYSYYYFPDPKAKFSPDDKELFECSYCKSGKENLHSLKKHSDLMHSESQFKVRGYVNRNSEQTSSIIACGYCYHRLGGRSDLKRHTALYHPSLPQKSVGGFRTDNLPKGSLDESDDIPNKRMKLGPKVYVCSHCGAAFAKQEQVTVHTKRTHARFKLQFTTINTMLTDINFYKCEFCQFTAEKQYVDTHLDAKHKTRVTCNYCNKRFEFATRLREHHDIAHNGLPIKYSQETVGIKKEMKSVSSKAISSVKQETRPLRSTRSQIQNSTKDNDLENIFTYSKDSGGKISVLKFSQLHDIFPKVTLKDIMKQKKI